jgi:hypothetical protein
MGAHYLETWKNAPDLGVEDELGPADQVIGDQLQDVGCVWFKSQTKMNGAVLLHMLFALRAEERSGPIHGIFL